MRCWRAPQTPSSHSLMVPSNWRHSSFPRRGFHRPGSLLKYLKGPRSTASLEAEDEIPDFRELDSSRFWIFVFARVSHESHPSWLPSGYFNRLLEALEELSADCEFHISTKVALREGTVA